jgi:hypothetical protein
MFHLTDGLYFQQLPNGTVSIVKKENAREGAATDWTITIDAEQWASVIASMSHYGEENYGFYRALSFHRGDSVPSSAMPVEADLRRQWPVKDFAVDTSPPFKGFECGHIPSEQ